MAGQPGWRRRATEQNEWLVVVAVALRAKGDRQRDEDLASVAELMLASVAATMGERWLLERLHAVQ